MKFLETKGWDVPRSTVQRNFPALKRFSQNFHTHPSPKSTSGMPRATFHILTLRKHYELDKYWLAFPQSNQRIFCILVTLVHCAFVTLQHLNTQHEMYSHFTLIRHLHTFILIRDRNIETGVKLCQGWTGSVCKQTGRRLVDSHGGKEFFCGQPSLLSDGQQRFFLEGTENNEAWRWSLTAIWRRD